MDKEYLKNTIEEVNDLRKTTFYHPIDDSDHIVTFMPTKQTSYCGYKQGYMEKIVLCKQHIKETKSIRSSCKNYLRFIKNQDGETMQIEHYVNGKLDCLHQILWKDSTCYQFPYSPNGGYYPTYTYVTRYENGNIIEEAMVGKDQIIYETYYDETSEYVHYDLVHYLPNGKYLILEEKSGLIYFHPLRYEETAYDTWLNHRSHG